MQRKPYRTAKYIHTSKGDEMKDAIIHILYRIYEWKEGKSNPALGLQEPQGINLSYIEKVCKCGQIFYTDGEIPNHFCSKLKQTA